MKSSLWFINTFGPSLGSIVFSDTNSSNYSLTYQSGSTGKKYDDLPEVDKTRVKELLFIMDQFCISDAAYHEVTMQESGKNLPRSYLVKQCKESKNSLTHIKRTPGLCEGAQVNLYDTICSEIQIHVSTYYSLYLRTMILAYRYNFYQGSVLLLRWRGVN